ncbi:unnamed protein product, partial [Amoebophrya sp. A25]|eukprot:GSA25T00021307001.1
MFLSRSFIRMDTNGTQFQNLNSLKTFAEFLTASIGADPILGLQQLADLRTMLVVNEPGTSLLLKIFHHETIDAMLDAGTQGIRESRLKDSRVAMETGEAACALAPLEMHEALPSGGVALLLELMTICVAQLFGGDLKRNPCLIVNAQVLQYFNHLATHMSLTIADP